MENISVGETENISVGEPENTSVGELENTAVGEPENISMFSIFSMFSTCSELTPRAPIRDGRMEQLLHPWIIFFVALMCTLYDMFQCLPDHQNDIGILNACLTRVDKPENIICEAIAIHKSLNPQNEYGRSDQKLDTSLFSRYLETPFEIQIF